MKNSFTSSKSSNLQREDKKRKAQLIKVFNAFFSEPKTMKEVDFETGVMRESICRYCKILRERGQLFAVTKRQCRATKFLDVTAWSTNPIYAPKITQLSLFA